MNPITLKLIIPLILLISGIANAQSREVLFSSNPSSELQDLSEKIKNLDTTQVPYANLTRNSNYFVRIAPRKNILTEQNQLQENAILGTRPYVFITTPEGLYGKTLLDVYLDIGYEAEDVIHWQRNQDMVAVLFRYEGVAVSDERNGDLSGDWMKFVYAPTWDNIFSIFGRLASHASVDASKQGEFAPVNLFFKSEAEKSSVLNFSDKDKQHIKETGYQKLKAEGGEVWAYRKLLENKQSAFEHFRGNGRTQNEIKDPDGSTPQNGLLEFVGPNRKIKELPELAVIDLGKLIIEDSVSLKPTPAKWVDAEGGQIPANAVEAGREAPAGNEALYICRAEFKNGTHPGKIRSAFRGCNIGWGGKEIAVNRYQVLVQ